MENPSIEGAAGGGARATPPSIGKAGVVWAAIAGGAIALTALGIPIYWKSAAGGGNAMPPAPAAARPGHAGNASTDFPAMTDRLAAKLETNPEDARGWALLGRSYLTLGRYPESVRALQKAVRMAPGNADAWADLADAMVMDRNRRWSPDAGMAVANALKAVPDHEKGLWLAGTEAFERGDYKGALKYWERLAIVARPESGIRDDIEASLAEAHARLGKSR
ncbi:MAG: tetratricopeptide repeat protein [Rhodocyclaceae bacterium]|nr:tetratricopeptide repeat protein [Rhodocyclaceae bacterium]